MKLITGLLFAMFVTAPANAIAKALAASTLWSWFASRELGAGPSFGVWFGLALIFSLALNMALRNLKTEKTDPDRIILEKVIGCAATWAGVGLLLGSSYIVGSIAGWV